MHFVLAQVWIVFLLVVYISPLGKVKLGKPNDVPEYPTSSWFMMLFSAGIGSGLFFFGIAEPMSYASASC
jgi:glycine betaine transporter